MLNTESRNLFLKHKFFCGRTYSCSIKSAYKGSFALLFYNVNEIIGKLIHPLPFQFVLIRFINQQGIILLGLRVYLDVYEHLPSDSNQATWWYTSVYQYLIHRVPDPIYITNAKVCKDVFLLTAYWPNMKKGWINLDEIQYTTRLTLGITYRLLIPEKCTANFEFRKNRFTRSDW